MKRFPQSWVFVMLVLLIPFSLYAAITWYQHKFSKLPVYGTATTGSVSFINQDNKPVTTQSWSNKIVVVDFFFTHCISVCPKMAENLKKVQQAFSNDASVGITSFTVDPEDDSASQLKSYSQKFNIDNSKWQLLTGDKKEIYKLARNDFNLVATDGDGGATDFIHSDKLVLLDKQQRIRGYYDGTDEKQTGQLINDIIKLEHEK